MTKTTYGKTETAVLRTAIESYRRGDPISDDELEVAIPLLVVLDDLLGAMGERAMLFRSEARRYLDAFESFKQAREKWPKK